MKTHKKVLSFKIKWSWRRSDIRPQIEQPRVVSVAALSAV